MEYAIYPFDYMRITQRHDEGNHLAHWYPFKGCSDKPWDEALSDGGRDYFVPKNDYLVVEKIKNNNGCNNIILMSCNMLKIPYQETPTYIYLSLTHMNDDDYNKVSVGQILHKGERIIREGTSGATGNHFHVTAGLPEYYGYKQNGNGKYCFVCDKALEPNQAFYVDDTVDILDNKLYDFTPVPTIQKVGTPVERNTSVDQINVKVPELRARKEPSLNGEILGFINEGYYNIEDKTEADGYTWYKVQNMWIAYNEEWEDILLHEETKEDIQIEYKNRLLEHIDEFFIKYIEK